RSSSRSLRKAAWSKWAPPSCAITTEPAAPDLSEISPHVLRRRSACQELGDQEGHLQRLLVVEARVHLGFVASGQTFVVNFSGATHDFGDVIAGKFDMNAAGNGAQRLVHLKEAGDFIQDGVKA